LQQDQVASPAEIAKAYMGSKSSKGSPLRLRLHVLRDVTREEEEWTIWCIDRGPLGYIYEYKRRWETPNPRLEYNDTYTLNTPPQMQREYNGVAFEEWY